MIDVTVGETYVLDVDEDAPMHRSLEHVTSGQTSEVTYPRRCAVLLLDRVVRPRVAPYCRVLLADGRVGWVHQAYLMRGGEG